MSCNVTTVSCQRIGVPVVVNSSRVAEEITINTECVRVEVDVTAERIQMAVAATSERTFENPKVASGIICEIISRKNLLLRDKSLRLLRTRSGKLLYVVK